MPHASVFLIGPPPLVQVHFHKEAAGLLMQLARTETANKAPPLRLKKLYLLAALEVDQLKAKMLNIGEHNTASPSKASTGATGTAAAAHTLAGECASKTESSAATQQRHTFCISRTSPFCMTLSLH